MITKVILFCTLFIKLCVSHTWMLNPTPRLPDLCMPSKSGNSNCCLPKPNSVRTTYQRGQIVKTNWGRNNHRASFIRYSIVKLTDSDIQDIFNRDENIFQYNCYMTDCFGANNNPWAGDPGGTPFNGIKCNVNIQIPGWLDDGDYTIQWRWFSGGDSFGINNLGLIDFVTCHDFKIQGGPRSIKPSCPLFIGGDVANPNLNTCEYFKDNVINACVDDKNCFSWYHRAPPQKIIDCPNNIITLKDSFNNNFKGSKLPLFIGPTTNPKRNPNPGLTARIPSSKIITAVTPNKKDSVKQICVCNSDLENYCQL